MAFLIDVSIWQWRAFGVIGSEWASVGHVMVSDTSDVSLLSQFPHGLHGRSVPKGPNTKLSFQDTYTEEEYSPDVIFRIAVNDKYSIRFREEVADHVNRPIWDWDPTPPLETHCARAGYDALRAAGVAIDPENRYVIEDGHTNEILPNSLWMLLEDAGYHPRLKKWENFAQKTIEDNEKIVSFARAQRLWTQEFNFGSLA